MGKVTILEETTKNPITLIGKRAGYCWGSDTSDNEKNLKRGIECLETNHGRTLEFPDIHLVIEGYSARVIREWYTHIGGSPTRLQSSTRYVDGENFDYVIPNSVYKNQEALRVYDTVMANIKNGISEMKELGIPKEDYAMVLPLGMETIIVDKRNLRNFIEMCHQRLCTRANHEFRDLMYDILDCLRLYSEEWEYIVEYYCVPKCDYFGYCTEKYSCGIMPKKEVVLSERYED